MGYDLYLRPRQPELTPDRERVLEALRGAGWRSDSNTLPLAPTGATLRCQPVERGVDLEVPFGAPEADFRATLLLGIELATKLDLLFVDAQRHQDITPASADDSVRSWIQANKYAVDTAGQVEDIRSALPPDPIKSQWNTRSKLVVAVLALVVIAYQLLMLSVDYMKAPPRLID